MNLTTVQTPSCSANPNAVRNFLHRQLEIWTPEIFQVITRRTNLRTLLQETRFNDRSLGQTFGHESVNRFLNSDAILQDATDLISVLRDLFSIVCLMTCIFENVNNMQFALAMVDCIDLYKPQQLTLQKMNSFMDDC